MTSVTARLVAIDDDTINVWTAVAADGSYIASFGVFPAEVVVQSHNVLDLVGALRRAADELEAAAVGRVTL